MAGKLSSLTGEGFKHERFVAYATLAMITVVAFLQINQCIHETRLAKLQLAKEQKKAA